jgi:hypothetical protein
MFFPHNAHVRLHALKGLACLALRQRKFFSRTLVVRYRAEKT